MACFHVPAYGFNDEAIMRGAAKLYELAREEGAEHVGFAVPARENLRHLERSQLGPAFKALHNGDHATIEGLPIYLFTRGTAPQDFSGPVLAIITPPNQTIELAGLHSVTQLVYVPWQLDDLDRYLAEVDSAEL